jgi:hypothetical protein
MIAGPDGLAVDPQAWKNLGTKDAPVIGLYLAIGFKSEPVATEALPRCLAAVFMGEF